MKRTRSFLLLALGLITLLGSLTVWTIYREHRQERLNRDLLTAVEDNDTKKVVSLLDDGADANYYDVKEMMALLNHAKPRPWWRMLWDRFQPVKPKPLPPRTVLLLALVGSEGNTYRFENVPLVKALLEHHADVNDRGGYAYSPLLEAIWGRKATTVHLLLQYGAEVGSNNQGGPCPLTEAIRIFPDRLDVITDLLQRGTDVNQRNDMGNTALFYAICVDNVEAVRLLLSYHADVTLRGKWFSPHYDHSNRDLVEYTPLAKAKMDNDSTLARQIIRLLTQAGAKE